MTTITALAKELGRNYPAVWRAVQALKVPTVRAGGTVIIPVESATAVKNYFAAK